MADLAVILQEDEQDVSMVEAVDGVSIENLMDRYGDALVLHRHSRGKEKSNGMPGDFLKPATKNAFMSIIADITRIEARSKSLKACVRDQLMESSTDCRSYLQIFCYVDRPETLS